MLTKRELNAIGIRDWCDVAGDFVNSDLLLGNGFSLNLRGGSNLNYTSLFNEFLSHCSPSEKRVFDSFRTHNFELILEKLLSAKNINTLLRINNLNKLDSSIVKLRTGLIKAIEVKHPTVADIDKAQLLRLGRQFKQFNDIYTLNYDLFLYHIVMMILDLHKSDKTIQCYNDYFWHKYSVDSLQFRDFQNYAEYKHLYFLHGALFIFQQSSDVILKVRKRRDIDDYSELIEIIRSTISSGNMPLFVSEGTYNDKLESIYRSPYLRFALEHFANTSKSLVIYGTSLSDSDFHIAKAIKGNGRRLAIAIHVGNKDSRQLVYKKLTIEKRIRKMESQDIRFFDSRTIFNF